MYVPCHRVPFLHSSFRYDQASTSTTITAAIPTPLFQFLSRRPRWNGRFLLRFVCSLIEIPFPPFASSPFRHRYWITPVQWSRLQPPCVVTIDTFISRILGDAISSVKWIHFHSSSYCFCNFIAHTGNCTIEKKGCARRENLLEMGKKRNTWGNTWLPYVQGPFYKYIIKVFS